MKNRFHIASIICVIIVVMTMLSCTNQQPVEQQEKNSLEGVWQLMSGEWTLQDTLVTFPGPYTPDLKSYKFLYGEHWAVIGQNASLDMVWARAGIYRITEDTYVEYFEIHNNIELLGDSIVLKYTLDGDNWTVSGDWLKEEWKRIN